jgi:hypothetical protein
MSVGPLVAISNHPPQSWTARLHKWPVPPSAFASRTLMLPCAHANCRRRLHHHVLLESGKIVVHAAAQKLGGRRVQENVPVASLT